MAASGPSPGGRPLGVATPRIEYPAEASLINAARGSDLAPSVRRCGPLQGQRWSLSRVMLASCPGSLGLQWDDFPTVAIQDLSQGALNHLAIRRRHLQAEGVNRRGNNFANHLPPRAADDMHEQLTVDIAHRPCCCHGTPPLSLSSWPPSCEPDLTMTVSQRSVRSRWLEEVRPRRACAAWFAAWPRRVAGDDRGDGNTFTKSDPDGQRGPSPCPGGLTSPRRLGIVSVHRAVAVRAHPALMPADLMADDKRIEPVMHLLRDRLS
jgi:hypothetical protein